MADPSPPFIDSLALGDNLALIDALPGGSVDLCYVDPPFCTGKRRTGAKLPVTGGGRARAAGPRQSFGYADGWDNGLDGYLAWLRPRLAGMIRILKPAGSLLVHLDWRASHYAKVLLDEVAGRNNFVNEIIWHYASGGGRSSKRLARKHDVILWYGRGRETTCNLTAISSPRSECRVCGQELPARNHMRREKDRDGRVVRTIRSGGKIYRYYDDDPVPPCDVWLDISHLQQRDPERTGYPTQKPLALLERLVLLCSNPGDLVADFFMGTGTTLVAAAKNARHWLGCDVSPEALALAGERLDKAGFEPCAVDVTEIAVPPKGQEAERERAS